jgi:tRNA nucleotidyltransferase (CCA-adding enzyme)
MGSKVGAAEKVRMKSLKSRILKMVKPTADELKSATYHANEIIARLKAVAPKNVEIVTAGSVARGTQVRGSYDIDVFLLFPKGEDERSMEMRGVALAKKIVDKSKKESFIIKYAEHPYVKILLEGGSISADIVPAFKIKNALDLGSAVDRTPLHNEFVNAHLSAKQKDDVRIFKALLKNHNVYGAEAQVRGFSGYLCELLIFYYGSFESLIGAFSRIKIPAIINIGNKTEVDPKSEQGTALLKRFESDFLVIDPTDVNRNVAASVSKQSIAKLVLVSKALARKPVIEVFNGVQYSSTLAKEKLLDFQKAMDFDIYLLAFSYDDIAEDIIWEQLTKLRLRINDLLSRNGFAPLQSFQNIRGGLCIAAFFINRIYNGCSIRRGPSVFMGDATEAFLKAHRESLGLFLQDDRVISLEKSEYADPEMLLLNLKSGRDFTIPSHIRPASRFVYMNKKIPEEHARLLYEAFEDAMITVF